MTINGAFKELNDFIQKHRTEYCELAQRIWAKPELAFQEKFACAEQIKILKDYGFEVTSPYAGVDAAYVATYGSGKPTFCFVAEYDALPELGHACGHNLICTAAIAAGCAVKEIMDKHKIAGQIIVMGTPAEESGGGKVLMLKENCLSGVDAVMMVHPSWRSTPDSGSTAIRRFNVEFIGKSAHAAASPELGLNALDASILLFNGINAWRQQLPESARIHGIIKDGGVMPNIIPDYSLSRFYLRSTSDETLDSMEKRFKDMVKGAALMTGTHYEIKAHSVPYRSRQPNQELNKLYMKYAEEEGLNPVIPSRGARGSSDFGDFSQQAPGIHPYFGISPCEIAGHSKEFAEASNSEYGIAQMIKAAKVMARIGLTFMVDEKFREKVTASTIS